MNKQSVNLRVILLIALTLFSIVLLVPSFVTEPPQFWKDYLPNQRLNLGLIGDIGLLKHGIAAELGGQRLAALGIHIGDHHLGALGDEQLDGGAPDAARPARDDRDLAAQFLGHFTLQCLALSSPNPE